MTELTGRCLCGAVKFSAGVEKHETGACHCGMCRRWAGGPLFVLNCSGAVTFEGEENISTFRSSDWGERGFCKICGSTLFWRTHDQSFLGMAVGSFDDQSQFELTNQVFIDDKPDWYEFANQTKKMTGAEVIAMFTDQTPD